MFGTGGIPLSADEISILSEPEMFHSKLIQNIKNAKNRIILTSLYIGNGEMENQIYQEIEHFIERGGKATIIIDWNRGQRGKKKSTLSRLKSILAKYGDSHPESLKFYVRKIKKKMNYTLKFITFSSTLVVCLQGYTKLVLIPAKYKLVQIFHIWKYTLSFCVNYKNCINHKCLYWRNFVL